MALGCFVLGRQCIDVWGSSSNTQLHSWALAITLARRSSLIPGVSASHTRRDVKSMFKESPPPPPPPHSFLTQYFIFMLGLDMKLQNPPFPRMDQLYHSGSLPSQQLHLKGSDYFPILNSWSRRERLSLEARFREGVC